MKWIARAFLRALRSERGSVESALVIIPLMVLFLLGMQLSLFAHSRNMSKLHSQDEASIRAISGNFDDSDEFIHIESSGSNQNLDLLITRRESQLRNFIPGTIGSSSSRRSVDVQGMAIVENQR